MECLLCYFKSDEQTLKAHYERVHRVDPTNLHFKNLFTADANKNCRYCGRVFADSNQKKKHVFLRHYRSPNLQQVGGSRNTYLNILRRGKIIEFSINFEQHKNHYNFFNAQVVPRFLDVVYQNFNPNQTSSINFTDILKFSTGEVCKRLILQVERGLLTSIDFLTLTDLFDKK